MTESEKFLNKILTYVDDSDKKWFMCHKADIKAYAKIYHKEQLTLTNVSQRSELLFCGGCGNKKQLIVETDINRQKVCKNKLCEQNNCG